MMPSIYHAMDSASRSRRTAVLRRPAPPRSRGQGPPRATDRHRVRRTKAPARACWDVIAESLCRGGVPTLPPSQFPLVAGDRAWGCGVREPARTSPSTSSRGRRQRRATSGAGRGAESRRLPPAPVHLSGGHRATPVPSATMPRRRADGIRPLGRVQRKTGKKILSAS
jgi:hypothetical protein